MSHLRTQNGRTASYIVNAGDFDNLMERIELSRSGSLSRQQFGNGEFRSEEFIKEMKNMLDEMHADGVRNK